MNKTGCVIVKDFKRPERELVERFAGVAVANLDDCMNRISAVHEDICPVNKSRLLGTAFTVKVPEGDNLMFHVAMDLAKPGDVILSLIHISRSMVLHPTPCFPITFRFTARDMISRPIFTARNMIPSISCMRSKLSVISARCLIKRTASGWMYSLK